MQTSSGFVGPSKREVRLTVLQSEIIPLSFTNYRILVNTQNVALLNALVVGIKRGEVSLRT